MASYGNAEAALGGAAAAARISSRVSEAASRAWIAAGLLLPGRITAFYKVKCVASSYWKGWGRTMNDSLQALQWHTDPSCAWCGNTPVQISSRPSYVENAFAPSPEHRMGCLWPAFSGFFPVLFPSAPSRVFFDFVPHLRGWARRFNQIKDHKDLEQLKLVTHIMAVTEPPVALSKSLQVAPYIQILKLGKYSHCWPHLVTHALFSVVSGQKAGQEGCRMGNGKPWWIRAI